MDQETENPQDPRAGGAEGAGGARFSRAKEFVNDKYSTAAETAKRGYSSVRERVGEVDVASMAEQVREYIRSNPGKALLISVGVGFMIGLMLRRDDDDDEE